MLFVEDEILASEDADLAVFDVLGAAREIVDVAELLGGEFDAGSPVVGIAAGGAHILQTPLETGLRAVRTDGFRFYDPLGDLEGVVPLLYILDAVDAAVAVSGIQEERILLRRLVDGVQADRPAFVPGRADHFGRRVAVGDILYFPGVLARYEQAQFLGRERVLAADAHAVGVVDALVVIRAAGDGGIDVESRELKI